MKGLKIEFNGSRAKILPVTIAGDACNLQNAAVNLVTMRGSDKTFPEKGTTLLQTLIGSGIVDQQAAQHAANFAALDTLFFMREHDYPEEIEKAPTNLQLDIQAIALQSIRFSLEMETPTSNSTETINS